MHFDRKLRVRIPVVQLIRPKIHNKPRLNWNLEKVLNKKIWASRIAIKFSSLFRLGQCSSTIEKYIWRGIMMANEKPSKILEMQSAENRKKLDSLKFRCNLFTLWIQPLFGYLERITAPFTKVSAVRYKVDVIQGRTRYYNSKVLFRWSFWCKCSRVLYKGIDVHARNLLWETRGCYAGYN